MKKLLLIFASFLLCNILQAQIPLNIAEINSETAGNDLNGNENTFNSWDGFVSTPTGQKLSLNILVNIIYDQTPEMDPYFNNPGGAWHEETIAGINNSYPLPEWLADLFDTEYNENGITHGIFTRKFYESSFGNLYIIGDYVLVNIRQSYITNGNNMDYHQFTFTDFLTKSIEFLQANDGGLETLIHQHDYSEFDLNNDGDFDFVTMLTRNTCTKEIQIGDEFYTLVYGEINKGTGRGRPVYEPLIFPDENSLQIPWMTIQCIGNETDVIDNPVSAIYHEAGHFFIGTNTMHSGGGNGWGGNSGRVFLQLMGGYGIMGQSSTGLVSVNGFDRWWLHWKSPVYNTTDSYIAASNQPSDITQTDGTKNFILRDFVTTGDAIRIKLPYVDNGAKNQYIWLENHKIGLNDKLDFLQYSSDECRPTGKPGIYAYYQVGKDVLSGNNIRPTGESDHLRLISAEGNYDYSHLNNAMINCIANGSAERGKKNDPNSFMGTNDAMAQFYDKYPFPNTLTRDNAYGLFLKQLIVNGQWVEIDSIPFLMDDRDAFRGTRSFNLSSNPAPVNTTTFYNTVEENGIISINPSVDLVNNDTIYLTGLNIRMEKLANDDYKVTIYWGHNRLDNSVAWTGKIALKESLYLYDDDTLLLKQNYTPSQINRDPDTHLFAPSTVFDCRENSQLTLSNTSRMIASDKSKIYVQPGSVLTLQNSASLIVKSGSELIIEDCGNLVIRDNAQLVIEEGGIITIKSGDNVFIDGEANIILQPGYATGTDGISLTGNLSEIFDVPPIRQITSNTTWTGQTYKFFDDLYISPGATLNLTGTTLKFFRNAKVKVARGAKLNMAGNSKLTTTCGTELWQGVEVWGDPNISQSPTTNQGHVVMNNSTIELARTGVLLDRPMPTDGPGVPSGNGGGILQAENSTFSNNYIGVSFSGYSNDNISNFSNCLFTATGTFPEIFTGIDCHVNLNGVIGIDFLKCTFTVTNGLIHNAGIRSHNSNFQVLGEEYHGKYKRSVFENLKNGIYATASLSNRNYTVRNSVFRKCIKGIFASGVNNMSITNNLFAQPMLIGNPTYNLTGIYLEYCTGYTIQYDTIKCFVGDNERSEVGMYIKNSGPAENLVYNNVIVFMNEGIMAEGENRNGDSEGLCIKCNEFLYNKNDVRIVIGENISIFNQGIKKYQGRFGPLETDPAGNTFSNPAVYFNIDNELCRPIEYFHHRQMQGQAIVQPPYNKVRIFERTVTLTLSNNFPFNKASACPPIPNQADSKEELIAGVLLMDGEITETKSELELLTDEGDTPLAVYNINSSVPFEALWLHDELLGASPYLSDTVLVKAAEKEEVLNSALIRDVMVANPHSAKSNEVIEALEQRNETLPESIWTEINAGKNQISAKQALEISISDLMAEKTLSSTLLMQAYQEENKYDSLRWLLNLIPDALSAYKSTWTWFDEGNTDYGLTAIQNMDISSIPENHRSYKNGYDQLAEIINQLATDTSYILKYDTSALNTLQNLALNDNPAGISARNLLTAYRFMNYEAVITVPDTTLKSVMASFDNPKKVKEDKTGIHVFPNPADDYTIVSYNIEKSGVLELISKDGRVIRSENLKTGINQHFLRTNGLPSGVYTLSLKSGNKVLTTKLVIK